MRYWRGVLSIVAKDVAAELHSKEALSAMLVFALLAIVIFNFAFELRVDNIWQMAPGVLWVAFAFAGVLGFNRSFALEREGRCIEGLMLAPIDHSAIFLGKFLGNVLFMLVAEGLTLPVLAVLFDVPVLNLLLWLIVILGTVGLAAVGTLFAAMAVNTRARDVMLPVLLFPIVVPVIIAATKSMGQILDGRSFSEMVAWLRLLLAFDVIFTVIAFLGFEYVLEE